VSLQPDVLRALEPLQVAAWLRANGWILETTRPGLASVWRMAASDHEYFGIDLPLDPTFRDYPRRIQEILDTLAVAHSRTVLWILGEIRASTFDVLRFRSTGPAVGNGRVSLELGARLFAQARELIVAAASSAHEPRAVYRSRRPAGVNEFLRRAKFSTPEEGSFIVTVHIPVPPEVQLALEAALGTEPVERRATRMLAEATSAVREAAEQAALGVGGPGFVDQTARGISANLCDALANIVDGEEVTALDILFGWAPARPVMENVPRIIHFGSNLSPILRQGAQLLRLRGNTPDFEVEGPVVKLESDNPTQGGIAVVRCVIDGAPRKVRIRMPQPDYGMAIQAHDQYRLLRCEGELSQAGAQFQLERVRHVVLVADEE